MQRKIGKKLIVFLVLFGTLFLLRWVLAADFGTEAVNNGLNGTLASSDPRSIVGRIINIALGFLGTIAIGLVIYGGFIWMTSGGEEEKISQAKKILRNGVIGLIIILASWAIATFIISRLSGAVGGSGSGCIDGETSYCGCGGYMVCYNSSWGGCIGSDCGGVGPTSCDSSPNPGCQAVQSICASQDYCDDDDCACKPRGNLGDPCDADLNTPTCEADNNRCAQYLSCDDTTCTCFGPPVITGVSPVGGFCEEDFNKSCSQDSDCSTTCNQAVPNGAPDNFITIFGKNFGEYSATDSKVVFMGINNPHNGQQPMEINPDCVNTWQDNQIVIAVPVGVNAGAIKVVNVDGLEDTTDDEYGPNVPDFIANDVVRPGLCYLDPNQGLLSSQINYQGVNLYSGNAFFGNYDNNIRGLDSNFSHPSGLAGVSVTPNINSGESGSFVINNINGNEEKSNFLYFNKIPEEGEGPYITSFSPLAGTVGQYVTIQGDGFGGARGNNHVYFGNIEASYSFPAICANSVWKDKQIIVKVPDGISNGDYVIKIALGSDIIDTQEINPNTFEIDDNLSLKTSLCRIEPNQAPVASLTTIYGEYFGPTGNDGTVKFSPVSVPQIYGEIEQENDADLIEAEVPMGAITGPVKVIKNNEWGNELNFEVGECTVDADCDTQICCPQNTYKKGRCMDSLSSCFIDIPTSVFEWSFNTGFGNSTSTPFDSCSAMASYYGACQQGSFCPNVPGVCSPYSGGAKQVVANCDYSCNTVSGCGDFTSGTCNYDANLNKCVKSGQAGYCDLPQNSTYILGTESYEITTICNQDGHWEINTPTSCPDGWIRHENNRCVNESETCSVCDGSLTCALVGPEARCVSATICPVGAVCEDNPALNELDSCVITEDPGCDCCCRIDQSALDCCAPLECAGTCGEDTVDDDAGYGLCSGCAAVGTTTEEHDAACNCSGHTGQYCDINASNPAGVCVDCSGLAGEESCNDHSSVCCFDSNRTASVNDDYCRGGSGETISNDPNNSNFGYCGYYDCFSTSVPPIGDPTECASSTPVKVGFFKDINSCEIGCANNPNNDYCSTFNGQPISCMAEEICCFDQQTSECHNGGRIEAGQYEGYCAYYNCEDPTTQPPGDPTQCNLTAVTSGTFTSTSTCAIRCASNEGGVGQACTYYGAVEECAFEICSYPGFACLDADGALGTYPGCGTCCCDPSEPNTCSTPEAPNLFCSPDKGSCSGPNRGLCCGCTSDSECGNQATVGCGLDSCCQARPTVLETLPENGAVDVCRNSVIKVSFDQSMAFTSLNNNVVLFEERVYGNGVCPPGTFVSEINIFEEVKNKGNLFSRLINSIKKIFVRLDKEAWAGEPDPSKLYCSISGTVSEEKIGENSTLVFSPMGLLSPNTNYYLVVKGDEGLNSQSGVMNVVNIGFNGLGFEQSNGTYKEGSLIKFNGQAYGNSHITQFTTLSDQGPRAGICVIDKVVVSPDSYLFNKSINDLGENDDPNSSTFDTKADRDKVFTAWAYSADDQPLQPVTGYYWDWIWDVDVSKVSLSGSESLPGNKTLATINDALTDAETKLWANIDMDRFLNSSCSSNPACVCTGDNCSNNCCNIYSAGDTLSKNSDLYIFICDNPWPPVNSIGSWYPWVDNCDGAIGPCSDFNYKFYYCRDAGEPGTLDDLPAIINKAVIRGQSDSLTCSADRSLCSTLGSVCGPDKDGDGSADGVCIWNVLKESYFFREAVLPAGEITSVTDEQIGGTVEVYWHSAADQVDSYKIYYSKQGKVDMTTKEVDKDNGCQLSNSILNCHTTIDGLINNQAYIFKLSVISVNQTESNLSSEKVGIPTDQVPPSIPSGFVTEGVDANGTTITFTWSENTDDTLFYRLYRGINSNQYGESFDSTSYATSLVFNKDQFSLGNNYFALTAIDASGNQSPKTAELVVNISE